MSKAYDFLKECGAFFVLSVNGDYPAGRPFGAVMEVGDNFTVIEKDLKETTYEVKEIYTVEADDLKCLLQNEEKIEITLITCNNASTTRLIVKAEEVL